jgi:hypothetical protein
MCNHVSALSREFARDITRLCSGMLCSCATLFPTLLILSGVQDWKHISIHTCHKILLPSSFLVLSHTLLDQLVIRIQTVRRLRLGHGAFKRPSQDSRTTRAYNAAVEPRGKTENNFPSIAQNLNTSGRQVPSQRLAMISQTRHPKQGHYPKRYDAIQKERPNKRGGWVTTKAV